MSIYEIDFLFEDCVKSGEVKLLAEPERRNEAVSNLAVFVQRLIDDTRARGERSIEDPPSSMQKLPCSHSGRFSKVLS
jgi:hypothetical protein